MEHINFHTLKDMADNGLILGLKISNLDALFCETCQYRKLHRRPFQKKIEERALKSGEYLHIDLCGKMTYPSTGGSNYFLLFKDDCTLYRSVFFIKHKNDAFEKFLQCKKLMETNVKQNKESA